MITQELEVLNRIRAEGFRPSFVTIFLDERREAWNWPPFTGMPHATQYLASMHIPEDVSMVSLDLRSFRGLDVVVIAKDVHSRVDALLRRLMDAGVDRVSVIRPWQDEPLETLEILEGKWV